MNRISEKLLRTRISGTLIVAGNSYFWDVLKSEAVGRGENLTECLPYIHAEGRRMLLKADMITKDYVNDAGTYLLIFLIIICAAARESRHTAFAL